MPPVVSNTSPLINLAGIGQLAILPQLYGNIWIPELVLAEYQAKRSAGDPDLLSLPWLTVQPVAVDPALRALRSLGAGEAAVIALAQTHQAQLVILDDKRARQVAHQRGLPVAGTLGVLLAVKRLNLLPAIQPLIDDMVAQGRRISPALRDHILREAGEAAPEAGRD